MTAMVSATRILLGRIRLATRTDADQGRTKAFLAETTIALARWGATLAVAVKRAGVTFLGARKAVVARVAG